MDRRHEERRRERRDFLIEQDESRKQDRREVVTSTHKTARGDRVPRWPSTKDTWERMEALDEALRDLYAEAQRRAESDADMADNKHNQTVRRFPVAGGQ